MTHEVILNCLKDCRNSRRWCDELHTTFHIRLCRHRARINRMTSKSDSARPLSLPPTLGHRYQYHDIYRVHTYRISHPTIELHTIIASCNTAAWHQSLAQSAGLTGFTMSLVWPLSRPQAAMLTLSSRQGL